MNTRTILFLLLLISSTVKGQIPNSAFEFWSNNEPDEWLTNNTAPPTPPVTQSTDAYTGTYAIRGEVVDFLGNPYSPSFQTYSPGGVGFPISQAYASLTGWFKADMISTDVGFVQVYIYDNDPTPNVVGIGFTQLPSSANYQQFDVPIYYSGVNPPAFASINFTIVDTGAGLGFEGSYFIIDDLAFSNASHVGNINTASFDVKQNPVSNEIKLTGDFKSGESYQVMLVNSLGKIVINKKIKSHTPYFPNIDVSELAEGNYFLSLSDSKNTYTKSILISR